MLFSSVLWDVALSLWGSQFRQNWILGLDMGKLFGMAQYEVEPGFVTCRENAQGKNNGYLRACTWECVMRDACTCVCVCMCVCVKVRFACMWGGGACPFIENRWQHLVPSHFLPYALDTGSLPVPGARLTSSKPIDVLIFAHAILGYRFAWLCLVCRWIWTQVLMLAQKTLLPTKPFLQPQSYIPFILIF